MKRIKQQNIAYYLNPHYYSHQPENIPTSKKMPTPKNYMGLFTCFFVGTTLGFWISNKKTQQSNIHWKSVRNDLEKLKKQLIDTQKILDRYQQL